MNKCAFPLVTEEEKRLPFYLKSVGIMWNQEHVSRPAGYPDYHWLHCTRGKGVLVIEGRDYIISEDMGFFFVPGIPHEYYPVSQPWETGWITLNGHAVHPLLGVIGLGACGIYNIAGLPMVDSMLYDIYAKAVSADQNRGFECSSMLYKFLIDLKRHLNTGVPGVGQYKHNRIQPVIAFIEENYGSSPSLEELAALIDVTPQHLCRLFKQTLNMRPFTYLNRFRIKKAKELIIGQSNLSVREITKRVGYSDASYFCALFKEYEGITPMEFKRMYRAV